MLFFRFLYRGGGDKDTRAKEKEQNRERRRRARIRGITKSGRVIKGRGVFVSNINKYILIFYKKNLYQVLIFFLLI